MREVVVHMGLPKETPQLRQVSGNLQQSVRHQHNAIRHGKYLFLVLKKTVSFVKLFRVFPISAAPLFVCVVLLHTVFSLCSISYTRAPTAVSSNYHSHFCVSYICVCVRCSYSLQIV
jgi:hypothetical protein